jgi:hypothetical protein
MDSFPKRKQADLGKQRDEIPVFHRKRKEGLKESERKGSYVERERGGERKIFEKTGERGRGVEEKAVEGRLEVTIKLTQRPRFEDEENGQKKFRVQCDTEEVWVILKPKAFSKMLAAMDEFALWTATIRGGIGQRTRQGFILSNPGIQVFERKEKTRDGAQEED